MHAVLSERFLEVDLTVDECFRVRQGGSCGERINPLYENAKIEVFNLDEAYIGKDIQDRERRLRAGLAVAQVLTNDDMILYLPTAHVASVLQPNSWIPKDRILFPSADASYRTAYLAQLPEHGILANFAHSLRTVDLSRTGY